MLTTIRKWTPLPRTETVQWALPKKDINTNNIKDNTKNTIPSIIHDFRLCIDVAAYTKAWLDEIELKVHLQQLRLVQKSKSKIENRWELKTTEFTAEKKMT